MVTWKPFGGQADAAAAAFDNLNASLRSLRRQRLFIEIHPCMFTGSGNQSKEEISLLPVERFHVHSECSHIVDIDKVTNSLVIPNNVTARGANEWPADQYVALCYSIVASVRANSVQKAFLVNQNETELIKTRSYERYAHEEIECVCNLVYNLNNLKCNSVVVFFTLVMANYASYLVW
jgi:hypothetical protein